MEQGKRKSAKQESTTKTRSGSSLNSVSFEFFAPTARTVTLVGDFNNWDPGSHPLRQSDRTLWKVTMRLKSGTYQYKFVIDGDRWEEDPLNPNRVPNEHGTFNSVREVP